LGTIAAETEKKGIAICGKERWEAHKQTIASFWDALFKFFENLKPKGYKVYQDGLVADGKVGIEIVKDGLKRGSRNYEIINHLLEKGVILVKTEDINIAMKEYKSVKELANAKTFIGKSVAYFKYICSKNKILEERDNYIAKRIGETLKEEETGILFIGAHHNIIDKLPEDIEVTELKERDKILKYMKGYYFRSRKEEVDKLAEYLKEPIEECADEIIVSTKY
jgi:pheromone shutdown protein TraB